MAKKVTPEHAHDQRSSKIAASFGMDGSLRLLMEARAAGLSQSLALGLRTQETGVEGDGNVFGHDPTIFVGGFDKRHNHHYEKVTKTSYLAYRDQRGPKGGGGMQGIGPLQLTFYTFQDEADRLGGCWLVMYNYRVGFRDLAHLIRMLGSEKKALAAYNGGVSNPNFEYAASVLKHKATWHRRLKG